VRKWVGQLADVAAGLSDWMLPHRLAAREARPAIDLDLAWVLVERALRWTWALRARLNAEAKAAKAALVGGQQEAEPRPRPERRRSARPSRRPALARMARPDGCIDGRTAVEVVAQICVDLDAAATLLGNAPAVQAIAEIAAAARAMLGAPAETWKALPVTRCWTPPAARATAVAAMPAVARSVPAPDSG
jgi:hypothetical protein